MRIKRWKDMRIDIEEERKGRDIDRERERESRK